MKCATHPEVDTGLTCANCGTPICPRCMVETPVGMKCRQCARLQRLPTFQISAKHYLMATGVALGLAVAFGFAWGVVRVFVPFSGFFGFFIALGVGYGFGEIIHKATGRKRGTGLAAVAGLGVVACFLVSLWIIPPLISPYHFGIGFFDIVFVAVGAFVAANILR